jgi:alpha-N-arabinofuranosidase
VDWHDAMMHKADAKGAKTIHDQTVLEKSHPHANIVATEYGLLTSNFGTGGRANPGNNHGYLYSLDNGLYVASMLIDFINAGIPLAEDEQLFGYKNHPSRPGVKRWRVFGLGQLGTYPTFPIQAAGYVVSLFSHMTGSKQVATKVVNGSGRKPTITGLKPYPTLRVVASTGNNGKQLTLVVVNRAPKQNITVTIRFNEYHHHTAAEVWTVNGRTVASSNTSDYPKAVQLSKQRVQVGQGQFEYTFPAHSVTGIRLVSSQ